MVIMRYLLGIILVSKDALAQNDCFDYIHEMSERDFYLSGRKPLANDLVLNGETVGAFAMKMRHFSDQNETYSCGYTR